MEGAQVVVRIHLPGDVHVLAADHALHARRRGDLGEGGQHCRGAAALAHQHQVERLREEAVPGQDRHVLAEGDVARRPATPQGVVVDRRQVVVDQRVRVDELESRRGGQHRDRIGAAAPGGGQREHRADALAAGEE